MVVTSIWKVDVMSKDKSVLRHDYRLRDKLNNNNEIRQTIAIYVNVKYLLLAGENHNQITGFL